jgi:uncharacterized membrane protein YfcA
MDTSTIIGILLIGLVAGVLSGMVGIGGGIVIVPCLVLFFGLSQHTAQGTTLAMLSLPVSAISAYAYYQKGMVDWKTALLLCLGFIVGGYFGSRIAIQLPALTLKRIFAVMMILVAIKYLFIDKK